MLAVFTHKLGRNDTHLAHKVNGNRQLKHNAGGKGKNGNGRNKRIKTDKVLYLRTLPGKNPET